MKFIVIIITGMILLSGCTNESEARVRINDLESALSSNAYIIEVERIVQFESFLSDSYIYDSVVVFRIRYKSDGYEVMGYVGAPYDYLNNTYPILIYNRGGHFYFGVQTPEVIGFLASRGYIVLGSQYRGIAGGTGVDQFGGNEIEDILTLICISESFGFVEPENIFMAGASRGGMMTYIALRHDDRIRAAAVWAAISNSFELFDTRASMQSVYISLVGGSPNELPEEYERRSAMLWAYEINTPILIGHGTNDWRIPYSQSVNMSEALAHHGNIYKLLLYPDVGHDIIIPFLYEMDSWFAQHMVVTYY